MRQCLHVPQRGVDSRERIRAGNPYPSGERAAGEAVSLVYAVCFLEQPPLVHRQRHEADLGVLQAESES